MPDSYAHRMHDAPTCADTNAILPRLRACPMHYR
jgi:hypothetical protein